MSSPASPPSPTPAQAHAQWQQLPVRERLMLSAIGATVLAVLLWFVALGPAIKTWRTAAAEQTRLDAQIQQVQQARTQIQQMQGSASLGFDAAYQALNSTTAQYLPHEAQMALAGEQVSITLKHANAHFLAQWLSAARNNAKAVPLSAQLTVDAPNPQDAGSSSWSGTMVMRLPPKE